MTANDPKRSFGNREILLNTRQRVLAYRRRVGVVRMMVLFLSRWLCGGYVAIIDNGEVRLPDGHPLKWTRNDSRAKQPLSLSNAFPKEPAPPLGAKAERVAVSGTSRTRIVNC